MTAKKLRLALLIALMQLASTAGVANASIPSIRFALVRTTTGPSSFMVSAQIPGGDDGAFAAYTGVRSRNGKVEAVTAGSQTSYGRADELGVYSPAATVTSCTVGACGVTPTVASASITTHDDDGGPGANNVYFFVFEGTGIEYTVKLNGWKLVPVPFEYRYVDSTNSSNAVSVGNAIGAFEVFFGASAPGGPGGSIAQAVPPCSNANTVVVPGGVGQIKLDGGTTSPSSMCPTDSFPPIAAFAPAATTWNASGLVVGDRTLKATRLFVIDLPKPDSEWALP